MSYQKVRASILSSLQSMPQSVHTMSGKDLQQLFTDETLAQSYWSKVLRLTKQPSDSDAIDAMVHGRIPNNVFSMALKPVDSLNIARSWLFDLSWRKPQEAWKASLHVDYGALGDYN